MEQGWGGRAGVGKGVVGEEGLVWLEKQRDRGPHLLPGQGSPPHRAPFRIRCPVPLGAGACVVSLCFVGTLACPSQAAPPPPGREPLLP